MSKCYWANILQTDVLALKSEGIYRYLSQVKHYSKAQSAYSEIWPPPLTQPPVGVR